MKNRSFLTVLLFLIATASAHPSTEVLTGSFFATGHGASAAVRTPTGRWILIDTGPSTAFCRSELIPQLWQAGFRKAELLIITHAHSDHIGGAHFILTNFPVKTVWDPGWPHTGDGYPALLQTAQRLGTVWQSPGAGETLNIDGITLSVLHPPRELLRHTGTDANNNSLVIRLSYGSFSILFTGDLEQAGLQQLSHGRRIPPSTILVVPHHGNLPSSGKKLLQQCRSRVLIVSCGQHRGHFKSKPSLFLQRFSADNRIPLLRTDLNGTVSFIYKENKLVLHWHAGEKTVTTAR